VGGESPRTSCMGTEMNSSHKDPHPAWMVSNVARGTGGLVGTGQRALHAEA
jgi:hypothetical protein